MRNGWTDSWVWILSLSDTLSGFLPGDSRPPEGKRNLFIYPPHRMNLRGRQTNRKGEMTKKHISATVNWFFFSLLCASLLLFLLNIWKTTGNKNCWCMMWIHSSRFRRKAATLFQELCWCLSLDHSGGLVLTVWHRRPCRRCRHYRLKTTNEY